MPIEHKVKQGECLSSIAKKYGLADWRIIYDYPQNAEFKRKRPNPNLICPGDKIFIPDKKLKEEGGGTENRHKFRVQVSKTFLRLIIQAEDGKPLSGKQYELHVEKLEIPYEGTIGGDGLIEQEIPADAEEGKLTVWMGENTDDEDSYTCMLKIGHLDPIDEISGVQARLNNLGFHCGPVDGILGLKVKEGLKSFQAKIGLEPTGEINDETKNKLRERHDGG